MIPRDFHFSALEQAWQFLWLLPIIALLCVSWFWRRRGINHLVHPELQPFVLLFNQPVQRVLKGVFFVIGWILAVFAWMDPLGNQYYPDEKKPAEMHSQVPSLDLYILLDVSQSMAVADEYGKRTRLELAEELIDRLAYELKEDALALFLFSGDLVPLVPLTFDTTFLRLMLTQVELNAEGSYGTQFAKVFNQLKVKFADSPQNASKAILLFTDGGDNLFETAQDKPSVLQGILQGADSLKTPIFTIGLGTQAGGIVPEATFRGERVTSKLEDALLIKMSESTGGKYFSSEGVSVDHLAGKINQALSRLRWNVRDLNLNANQEGVFRHYFQIPLFLSLMFFILSRYWPKRQDVVISLMLCSQYCFSSDTGSALYESGQFQNASEWYYGELKDLPPEWLRDKLLYNWGTSLLAEEKWAEANRAFFAVSAEGYEYPLFRLRLLYNQAVELVREGEKKQDPRLLQNALFLLQLGKNELCTSNCPEELFGSVIEEIKRRLTLQMGAGKSEETEAPLEALIRQFHLAALLPHLSDASLFWLETQKPDFPPLKKALEAKELKDRRSFLLQAAFALEQLRMSQAVSPETFLEAALDAVALLNNLEAFDVHLQQEMVKDASRFFTVVREWQKKGFSKGECQCAPWKDAIPLFSEGLHVLEEKPFPGQLFFAYNKWVDVLARLKQGAASPQQQPSDELRELREMQELDKKPKKAKMKSIGEEMPW